jgi:hypothetical protein
MKKTLKTLLASAGTAALLASAPAQAMNIACPAGLGLDQCFAGAIFNSDRAFSDLSIGTLTLGSGSWNLAGFFGANGANNLGLSLVGASTITSDNGSTFNNVAGGTYSVRLAGNLTGAPFFGTSYLGTYGGGFDVKSAVPEPQTVALMLAGLAVVGAAARRKQAK